MRPRPTSTGYSPEAALAHTRRVAGRRGVERAQRRQHALGQLRGAAVALGGRQEGVGELLVQRAAFGGEREEGGAVARERAIAGAAQARPGERRVDVEQERQVRDQRRAHARGQDAAAAERDHARPRRRRCAVLRIGSCDRRMRARVARARGIGEQSTHHRLLGGAEGGLAVELELARDRMAEALLEHRVAVERLHPERARQRAGDGGLAGAHQADQHERPAGDGGRDLGGRDAGGAVGRYPRHPMRCS